MKNQKRELKFFTIAEYEQEQEYLRRRHNEGWRLLKVTLPGIYLFEACEAEDVIYQLDYHKEGLGSQDTYVKMFKDCGWEYMFDFSATAISERVHSVCRAMRKFFVMKPPASISSAASSRAA